MKTINYTFRALLVPTLIGLVAQASAAGGGCCDSCTDGGDSSCGAPTCCAPACSQPCCCDPCCGDLEQFYEDDCGTCNTCVKECTTKKKEFTCFMGKCEDHCVPGSPPGGMLAGLRKWCYGSNGGSGCGGSCSSCGDVSCTDADCGCTDPAGCGDNCCCVQCSQCEPESCFAKLRVRKKLYKRVVEIECPTAKWTVQPACDPCGGGCGNGDAGTGAPGLDETPEEAVKEDDESDIPPAPQPMKSARLMPPRLQAKNAAVKSQIRNPVSTPRTAGAHVKPAAFQSAVKHRTTPTTSSNPRSSKLRDKKTMGSLFE